MLLALLLLTRYPRAAKTTLWALVLSLLALSSAPVSNLFVSSLERQTAVLQNAPNDTALILVLGYGHHFDPTRPPNSILMAGALSRISEGVRLWKTRPQSKLVISGAKFRSELSHAQAMKNAAIELGVPVQSIISLPETRDTEEELLSVVPYLRQAATTSAGEPTEQRLVIVSSATHLARAGRLAANLDLIYSVAPTDFLVVDAPWFRFNAHFLNNVNRAAHEWIGLLWYRLKGQ